jgi:hypothetical protein
MMAQQPKAQRAGPGRGHKGEKAGLSKNPAFEEAGIDKNLADRARQSIGGRLPLLCQSYQKQRHPMKLGPKGEGAESQ